MIYKFIDIPNHKLISDKVYDYILSDTKILADKVVWNWAFRWELLLAVPELKQALDLLNLEIDRIAIINTQPGSIGNIHIDYDTVPRMLWPIRNCVGSYTNFYNVDPTHVINHQGPKGDKSFHTKYPELAEKIDTLELIAPVIFKPWIAHEIVTNPLYTDSRISMTIRFKNNTDHVFPKD
jgi:hypothetical protein